MPERRNLPPKLSSLRQKLGEKAKREPKFRFYTLYDRIYRLDTLQAAWQQVCSNKGAAGIDGVTIADIENSQGGAEQFILDIQDELRTRRYRPSAVRRTYVPKPDGGQRPLGIPTVKDRVVQTATLLILEPIFEADFLECSYGFRPGRSAHQALEAVKASLKRGQRQVYDADLAGYFDSIPHDKLMACLEMRIADRTVLKLIRMWLQASVIETDDQGRQSGRRSRRGTPQGGVISPLLSNIYLHWLDKRFHAADGPGCWARATLVRYADDVVILARYQGTRLQDWVHRTVEDWMGLSLNWEKTRIVDISEGGASLDFLGYTFRYDRDIYGRSHRYLNLIPSAKTMSRERARIRELTDKSKCFKPLPQLINDLNRHLQGWSNYFAQGYPRKAFRGLNSYVRLRLMRQLRRRSQRVFRPPQGKSYHTHFADMGLIYL
jgi:RNA-directed DNA polymerase